MSCETAKKAAGYAAAELVKNEMRVGLGTGSTAFFFIERLIERVQKENIKIQAIATSKASSDQAKAGGIELIDPEKLIDLDIDVDGADEIDPHKNMIKGGGGALFREKIIASCAKEMIVIVDETKVVERLGKHPLPIEVTPYGYGSIIEKLKRVGIEVTTRLHEGKNYLTDNGNFILDANLEAYSEDFLKLDQKIIRIPGVIETGFFWHLAGRIVIGYSDGRVEIKESLGGAH